MARGGAQEVTKKEKAPSLTSNKLSDKYLLMEASVTELLREFPRLRRAALAGEKIIIRSREGDLQLMREPSQPATLVGVMRGQLVSAADDIDQPATKDTEWVASL